MRKRIWAILLCLALAAGMLPTAALAGSVFPDVADDADYAWAAKLTNEMGIFTGDENGNFNPGQGITRAQCAAVVCRLLGAEADAKGMTTDAFTDVPSSHWASSYIAWAYDRGIINGYGNGKFGADDDVTREQLVVMLMRYAALKGIDTTAEKTEFKDNDKISDWAQDSAYWAKSYGLVLGRGDGAFDPVSRATRGEIAAVFMRFCENVLK